MGEMIIIILQLYTYVLAIPTLPASLHSLPVLESVQICWWRKWWHSSSLGHQCCQCLM